MKTLMIRYKVKKDQAAANEELVHAVFDEVRTRRPAGLRYATFRLDDGVTFVHIATMAEPAAGDALTGLPSFKAFQKNLHARCVEAPEPVELHPVDSYDAEKRP
jgi:quinol monooxygenase YgiN